MLYSYYTLTTYICKASCHIIFHPSIDCFSETKKPPEKGPFQRQSQWL